MSEEETAEDDGAAAVERLADAQRERADAAAIAWFKVWTLSLAVGNGAGLLALGSALKDAKGALWFALLPAMWLFMVGLLAAGAEPFARARLHTFERRNWGNLSLRMGGGIFGPEPKKQLADRRGLKFWRTGSAALNAVAAIAFAGGITWALAAITFGWG
ncbi:hypothetical protein DMC25_06405 [Caulobacter sp. D4A]|uniref:hypothetical protein n=1 Tax=unclassified Caulobacter TaxID=2648921 RepID=UPI000D7277AA|nr:MULTISPECIES: hypothetical protein [unclassified Caulobacter]PXA91181.1 hypothetical protein DMC25_06405 [Caulobacter sp. D4A]PXA96798.1 hypothetical protein DMC18_00615 [Caulobacter sp. D5]